MEPLMNRFNGGRALRFLKHHFLHRNSLSYDIVWEILIANQALLTTDQVCTVAVVLGKFWVVRTRDTRDVTWIHTTIAPILE